MTDQKLEISTLISESIEVKSKLLNDSLFLENVGKAAIHIQNMIKNGGTLYACGNGGSACDAMHFVEELVARYKRERQGIKAMHFMDASTLTCWSNDYSYASAFKRQAETFCTEKDILLGISTSGNSQTIIDAVIAAKQKNCFTIALSGKDGGKLKEYADLNIIVPANATERIQEAHITVIHILCELTERWMLNV